MDASKKYWGNLAKEGYIQEMNKETETVSEPRNKKAVKKVNKVNKSKHKCGHCQKLIGQKVALQCESCDNLNLVECLKDIEEGRIKDFMVGSDKFYCTKCVSNVNLDTLAIEAPLAAASMDTLEEN